MHLFSVKNSEETGILYATFELTPSEAEALMRNTDNLQGVKIDLLKHLDDLHTEEQIIKARTELLSPLSRMFFLSKDEKEKILQAFDEVIKNKTRS